MSIAPTPRGPVSAELLDRLHGPVGPVCISASWSPDPLVDEDLQLALTVCYELHYRGVHGVDDRWEWEPSLLALRRELEDVLEAALRREVDVPQPADASAIPAALRMIAASEQGPSLSKHLARRGTVEQFREFVAHRSIYQLKEADPHSWAIPRLHGAPKAALVEIQSDEYGDGRPERMHAALFAKAMRGLGLDDGYGAYIDHVPAITLATVNLMSLFGLHRRLRGAIVGHLALFEMTSAVPNRRYGDALRRLRIADEDVVDFFDEHVEADAVHESVAAVDLAGGLARCEPQLADQILFGACALLHVERRWSEHLLGCWERDEVSLRLDLRPEAVPSL
jgi:hypothetical protein